MANLFENLQMMSELTEPVNEAATTVTADESPSKNDIVVDTITGRQYEILLSSEDGYIAMNKDNGFKTKIPEKIMMSGRFKYADTDIYNPTEDEETLIDELKTDTNYDEISYHIHEFAKTDKEKADKLMDLLFELEDNYTAKECADKLIMELSNM